MEILSAIALILLILVGYSSGVTLASRKQAFLPTILDLVLVTILWVVSFWLRSRGMTHWLLVGVGLLLGLLLGYAAVTVRLSKVDIRYLIPKSELPEHARERVETAATGIFRKLWRRWSDFASIMGNVQARLIMGFFYFIFVTPFGLATRILADPLMLKRPNNPSGWVQKQATDTTIDDAKEQG
jgi:hypothetical protein